MRLSKMPCSTYWIFISLIFQGWSRVTAALVSQLLWFSASSKVNYCSSIQPRWKKTCFYTVSYLILFTYLDLNTYFWSWLYFKSFHARSGDHTVKIIDCQTGRCVKVLSGHRRTPWVVRMACAIADLFILHLLPNICIFLFELLSQKWNLCK